MTEQRPTCATCLWFDPFGENKSDELGDGLCRGGLPQLNPEEVGAWPSVVLTDFCRCWQPLPQVQVRDPSLQDQLRRVREDLATMTAERDAALQAATDATARVMALEECIAELEGRVQALFSSNEFLAQRAAGISEPGAETLAPAEADV